MAADTDPGGLRVCVRSDLRFTLQNGEPPYYVVEDPLNSRFFRLGISEWSFVSALDGKRTMREAIRLSMEKGEQVALEPADAFTLANWLVANRLAKVVGDAGDQAASPSPQSARGVPSWLNPLFVKVPLGNPDRFLTNCLPYFRWMLGAQFFLVWLVACTLGSYQILANWSRFASSLSNVLAPNNWIHLLLTWVALKVLHELWHGLVCKRFGGDVPRFGVMFILFSPIAFVDVTTSWRFRSKWQRIYTSAAGMYIEFFVAGVAACLWAWTDNPIVAHVCHNVVITASLSTAIFNANILMRFDGYYILSDLLGVQNLYTKGQQYTHSLGRRFALGLPTRPVTARRGHLWIIKLYGIAALVWRWFFYIGIIIVAAKMFGGAGIVLAAMAFVLWFAIPCLRLIRFVILGGRGEQPNRLRFALVAAGASAAVFGISSLPWPGGLQAPGVIEYAPFTMVRAESEGFVKEVLVKPGEPVTMGTPVVILSDPDAEQNLANIDLQIKQSYIKGDILKADGETSQYLVEIRRRGALIESREELQMRVNRLIVRAPKDGDVIGRNLDSLVGQFVTAGTTLLSIGNEQCKEVLLSLPQSDVSFYRDQLNKAARLRVLDGTVIADGTRLVEIQPKATSQLPHVALSAQFGGPLPVRPVDQTDTRREAGESVELIEPRFVAKVRIPAESARSMYAGQLATVRMQRVGETIGQHLYQLTRNWLNKKLEAAARR